MRTESIDVEISFKDALTKLCSQGSYAFACFQLPNSKKQQLVISLQGYRSFETLAIQEIGTGFLVNKYEDQHPVKPSFIPADILIDDTNQVTLDPSLSGSKIEHFLKFLSENHEEVSLPKLVKENEEKIQTESHFIRNVQQAIDVIANSELEKIVLSRFEDLETEESALEERFTLLTEKYPSAFCSLVSLGNGEFWMGASPELLMANDANYFKTVSLAGTLPANSNFGWTSKEIEEQALVSRYIVNCFKKLRLREYHEYGPKTVQAGSLSHLQSTFTVDLTEVAFDGLADQMLELLHPTSAVCGMPLDEARNAVAALEAYDRSYYAGFLGPVNFSKTTELYVNLRCMRFRAGEVRVFAGAGITEDSDPKKEFIETELKMNVMKTLL